MVATTNLAGNQTMSISQHYPSGDRYVMIDEVNDNGDGTASAAIVAIAGPVDDATIAYLRLDPSLWEPDPEDLDWANTQTWHLVEMLSTDR